MGDSTVPKTIAFVHGVAPIGGAERELLQFLDSLPRSEFRPVVVCPFPGPLAEALRARGIEAQACEFPPWRKLTSLCTRRAAVRRLQSILNGCVPDLIHVNDIWWVPQVCRAAGYRSIPIVAHVRQEIEPPKVLRYKLDQVDLVLTVSRQIEHSVRAAGVPSRRVRTLYSGVSFNGGVALGDRLAALGEQGIPSQAFVIGTVANLFPRKGYDVMLKAMARLVPVHSSLHYLIVGTGDAAYEGALRQQAATLGLSGLVHFAGFREPVHPLLQAMDLYVQPSRMEGFGIAVVEAMAAGKAVVGTQTGGLPEVIAQGETGLLVPPDDEKALASAIQILIEDQDKRNRFGRAGALRAQQYFGVQAMMQGLLAAYQEALTRPASSRGRA